MNPLLLLAIGFALLLASPVHALELPEKAIDMTQPLNHAQMTELLGQIAAETPFVTVSEEGRSVEDRPLLLVRVNPANAPDPWRILLIGVQHGDEPAGKDAILLLIRDIAKDPTILPPGTELIAFPMINPDGTEQDRRRNATGMDLNRDHILLSAPETRALHRTVQQLKPDVIVDCHEYGRDPDRYLSRGWVRHSDIMMGAMNSPHFNDDLIAVTNQWVREATAAFEGTAITYREYDVGGPPPDNEQRFSTMTTTDARNGLGSYGAYSFIIESGRYTANDAPHADFGARVDAYHHLLTHLVKRQDDRAALRAALNAARNEELSPHLPVHFFWGNAGARITDDLVRDAKTGEDVIVPTPNYMHDRIIKRTVGRPEAYAIPVAHAEVFASLLDKHAVPYEVLTEARAATVEMARRNADHPGVEYSDTTSSAWAVELLPAQSVTLEPGTLIVPASRGTAGRKAALILEPTLVESLFEFSPYRELEDSNGHLPVLRLL